MTRSLSLPGALSRCRARRPGFTLIEVLVVVLVLGVLNAVAIPVYVNTTKTAARRAVKENMRTIAVAAFAYYARTGRYPRNFSNPQRNGTGTPSDFVGPGRDLACVPVGPSKVWYSWGFYGTNGSPTPSFHVAAYENGVNIWNSTPNVSNGVFFDLPPNRYYLQNGRPFN